MTTTATTSLALSPIHCNHHEQNHDLFWQSTPRSMAAVQQVVASPLQPDPALPQRLVRAPAPAAAARRPQCTHMSMVRGHSAVGHCVMCGKIPGLGWLYVCQQDRELDTGCADFTDLYNPTRIDAGDYDGGFEKQATEAESLEMSVSVVQGIRRGDYTTDQVQRLIDQKKHLRFVIRNADSPENAMSVTKSPPPGDIIASVGSTVLALAPAVQDAPSSSRDGNSPITAGATVAASTVANSSKGSQKRQQNCHFQVCHTCRPFFTERLPMSFERLLSGKVPAVTEDEIARMPIMNPNIVRNLGLRQAPLPSPPTISSPCLRAARRQNDGYDDESWSSTPTSATISESDSDQLEFADPYPCPGPGHCPLWSPSSGCAYDSGLNDGLRALNHGFGPDPETQLGHTTPENSLTNLTFSETPGGASAGGSSISLPSLNTAPLTPVLHEDELFENKLLDIKLGKTKGKAKTICAGVTGVSTRPGRLGLPYTLGFRANDSHSTLGSEVEVDGGVALTEEAVESGIPDIITNLE